MKAQTKALPCPITYNGQTYPTLKEFAVANNLNYSKVLARHRRGQTAEEIVAQCQYPTHPCTPQRQLWVYPQTPSTTCGAGACRPWNLSSTP